MPSVIAPGQTNPLPLVVHGKRQRNAESLDTVALCFEVLPLAGKDGVPQSCDKALPLLNGALRVVGDFGWNAWFVWPVPDTVVNRKHTGHAEGRGPLHCGFLSNVKLGHHLVGAVSLGL